MRIIFGLIGIIIGILTVWKSPFLVRTLGDIPFAEQYLGAGGTYTFYILTGTAFIIISALYMFGLFHFSVLAPTGP